MAAVRLMACQAPDHQAPPTPDSDRVVLAHGVAQVELVLDDRLQGVLSVVVFDIGAATPAQISGHGRMALS